MIELNRFHPEALRGFHDIYEPEDPPHRKPIPVLRPDDRIGGPTVKVDPRKIVGIVETNQPDEGGSFSAIAETTAPHIGENVAGLLASELARGRIPASLNRSNPA